MREIKFRAWDNTHNGHKMVKVSQIIIPDGNNEHGVQEIAVSELVFGANPSKWLIAPPLMQYTGLKDKNGVGIYEGDVVHCVENVFNRIVSFNAVIEWQSGGFWFRGLDYNLTDCNWHHYDAQDREVIGNIYENPELVEG